MVRFARNAILAAALAVAASTAVIAGPAQAVPYPNDNESITFIYYSDASKTVQVGMWVYGNCLEDFQYGVKTAYNTWTRTTCPDR